MTEATPRPFDWRVEERRSAGGLGDKQFIILSGDNTMIGAFRREERANEAVAAVNGFKQSNELLRDALGQLGVAQERTVTLEGVLGGLVTTARTQSHGLCDFCAGEGSFQEAPHAALLAAQKLLNTDCDHRGDSTHIEATP